MRCEGLIPEPWGSRIHGQFRRLPDYGAYCLGWGVYSAAMIMLEAVIPHWLIAHRDRMRDYVALHGPRVWACQYQQDVRFRSERLPWMMMRASDKLEEAFARGSRTPFDPAKPWDYLWELATSREEWAEWHWWYREFERKVTLIVSEYTPMRRSLGGDARVATHPAEHFASTHHAEGLGAMAPLRTPRAGGVGGGGGGNGGGGGGGGGAPSWGSVGAGTKARAAAADAKVATAGAATVPVRLTKPMDKRSQCASCTNRDTVSPARVVK